MDKENELTIGHYKEPLKKISKGEGFGYYGALCSTLNGEKVQCHVCGGLYGELNLHVRQSHKMSVDDYREKFQLAYTTALISEQARNVRKAATLQWIAIMKKKYGAGWRSARAEWQHRGGKKSSGTLGKKIRLETMNKRGTCPDQILDKIKKVAESIGHTPNLREFVQAMGGQRYKHLAFKVFGSWKEAIKMAGLQQSERAGTGGFIQYSDEELLEYLLNFARETKKVPTHSDFKRGLLPTYDVYTKRFGSIDKARELAGVYDFIPRETLSTGGYAKKI